MTARSDHSRDSPLAYPDAERVRQAHALLQAGRASEARAICEKVLAKQPGQADTLHLLALALRDLRDTEGAITAFQASLASRPRQPQLHNNLGNLLGTLGRFEDAFDAYSRALSLDPAFLDPWINMGLTAIEVRDFRRAISALERATSLRPASARAWHGLGSAYRAAGRTEQAVQALRRAVELDPGNGSAWVGLGLALRRGGAPEEALAAFDRAAAAGFTGPELEDGRAGALLDLGRTADGIAGYRALSKAAPTYVPAHDTLARLIWEHGLSDEPTASYRAALAAHPRELPLWSGLLGKLLTLERWTETLEACAAASRSLGDDLVLQLARARALAGLGEVEAATRTFAAATEAWPQHVALRTAFCRHLLASGRPDEAAVQAGRAIDLVPDSQEAWAYLGTAWRLMDDQREHWLHDYERLVAAIVVEPPAGIDDEAAFASALTSVLLPLHRSVTHPMEQTLRGGTQTSGMLFAQRQPLIQALKRQIEVAIHRYLAALQDDPTHPFLRRKSARIRFTGAWSVRLRREGFHVSHIHPEGWISSAYYVCLPPSVAEGVEGGHAGWIQFGQPPDDLRLGLTPRRHLRPRVGTLALFPSYTWHGTVPFSDADARMTVAFDAVPE